MHLTIHVFGATSPVAHYLVQRLLSESKRIDVICYSRSDSSSYNDLKSKFTSGDIIISLIPIRVLVSYLSSFLPPYSFPSKIICLSSSSVYSKVYSNSRDISFFSHFLIGELTLQDYIQSLPSRPKLIVLRTTMLWGDRLDKNIDFIYRFIRKFRFYPVNTSCDGLRAPLHFSQLADVIFELIFLHCSIDGTFFVPGDSSITFKSLLDILISLSDLQYPPLLVKIYPIFLRFSSYLSALPFFSKLSYLSSSIERQGDNLADFPLANKLPFNPSFRQSLKDLLIKTYA